MAERSWVEARSLAVIGAALALAGCAEDRQAFMLDNICRNQTVVFDVNGIPTPGCRLSGDATFTTGLSSDALAVKLGPGGGRLEIALAAIPAVHAATWSFDAMVASGRAEGSVLGRPAIDWGSCGVTCPGVIDGVEVDLTDEVRWAVLVDGSPGTATTFVQGGVSPIPPDVVITLQGSDIDILDIRTPGFEQNASLPPQF